MRLFFEVGREKSSSHHTQNTGNNQHYMLASSNNMAQGQDDIFMGRPSSLMSDGLGEARMSGGGNSLRW